MVSDDAVFMEFVFGCWQLRSTDMLAEEVRVLLYGAVASDSQFVADNYQMP